MSSGRASTAAEANETTRGRCAVVGASSTQLITHIATKAHGARSASGRSNGVNTSEDSTRRQVAARRLAEIVRAHKHRRDGWPETHFDAVEFSAAQTLEAVALGKPIGKEAAERDGDVRIEHFIVEGENVDSVEHDLCQVEERLEVRAQRFDEGALVFVVESRRIEMAEESGSRSVGPYAAQQFLIRFYRARRLAGGTASS